MSILCKVLTRKKVFDEDTGETSLARVLNTFDLTALGVGSTLGVGVYVLAGQVAKNTAGPAVILSFLIAAIASVFAGLCYAEFGARTPKAGSAYIYSYVCVGEFVAFVIGWNLILEYIIGSASVAKGLSSYVDNLCNGSLSNTFEQLLPLDIPYLSPYFDVFAFSVPILLSIALAFGMKESSLLNNIFTTCNIGVVLFVVIAGAMNAHWSNWTINPADVKNVNETLLGHGGFFPFGIQGVIKGAATCFYGFVGFDCIATTGEEVKNPKRAIPIAIICSLLVIFLAYFGTSTVLTLMVPYYDQNPTAPIPAAFEAIHWNNAALFVTFGAMFGLYASLFGAMFPLPRILYAMASDGLIFKCLGRVSDRFKTPVIGTLLAGMFTGTMAAIFNLDSLVDMMSIGTLLAYTIVAACVLLLRYHGEPHSREPINASEDTVLTDTTEEESTQVMKQIFNFGKLQMPNKISQTIVIVDICLYCVLCFFLGLCALSLSHEIVRGDIIPVGIVTVILICMALCMLSIASQPVSRTTLSFQVPFVPLVPALSILCNIYLMIMLDIATWIRFVVWMVLGVLIFCFTRRCLSSTDKSVRVSSSEAYVNNGYYDDNIVYSNGNDGNQETLVIIEEKKYPPLNIFEKPDESGAQTPSPSRVIESLDFVIDSFVDETVPPCDMSASEPLPASVLSNKPLNGDFRDTPNSALRSELLNSLNNLDSQNSEEVSNQNDATSCIDPDLTDRNGDFKESENDNSKKTVEEGIQKRLAGDVSSSDSESSYVSASSTIDTGQNNDLNVDQSIEVTRTPNPVPVPPPPPPMEGFKNFTKKVDSNTDIAAVENTRPKTLERLKAKSQEPQMIVTSNSLNSVKLRHVHRPSLERGDSKMVEDAQIEKEPSKSTNLGEKKKFIKAESSERKFENNKPSLKRNSFSRENDLTRKISRQARYVKSKSVNDMEQKDDTTKNENGSNTLKKLEISKDALSSVKLRPVKRPILPMDQAPQNDLPDSVKFGSLEFEEFKDKLNEKLKKPVKILREPSFIDPKTASNKPEIKVSREDVIDDKLDLKKARDTIQNEIGNKLKILEAGQNSKVNLGKENSDVTLN